MKKKILVLILCLLFVNSTAFSAQVRKRTGYSTYSTSQNKMVTTYYLVNSNGQRVSTQEYDYLNEINPNPGSLANYLFSDFTSSINLLANSIKVDKKIPVDYKYINSITKSKGKMA